MIQNHGACEPHLIDKVPCRQTMPLHKRFICLPNALLVLSGRQQLLYHRHVQALLKRTDHNQAGDVQPIIPFLFRSRQKPPAHIIIDRSARNHLLFFQLGRHIVEILHEQIHHLLHVQSHIRNILPFRKMIPKQILFPTAKFSCDQLFIVCHLLPISLFICP